MVVVLVNKQKNNRRPKLAKKKGVFSVLKATSKNN